MDVDKLAGSVGLGHMIIRASPTNLMISPPYLLRFFTIPSMYRFMANERSSIPLRPFLAHYSAAFVKPLMSAKQTTVSMG